MAALLSPRLCALTLHPPMPGAHTVIHTLSRNTALLLPPSSQEAHQRSHTNAPAGTPAGESTMSQCTHGYESPNPARTVPTTNGPRLAFPTPAE